MSEERDEFLLRIVTGDLDPESEAVLRRLEAEPELAERLQRLRGLQGRLDRVGDGIQADLATALEDGGGAAGADMLAAVRRADAAPASGARSRPWGWMVAAAAIVIVALVWAFAGTGAGEDRSGLYLSGDDDLEPNQARAVAAFDEFRWDLGASAGTEYVVRIYAAEEDVEDDRWLAEYETTDTELRPPATDHRTWPDTIYWTVEAFDMAVSLGARGTLASRSR